jgi:uncharacterized membrane protein YeaQ/YmgE (transglycosylase-associated protein family)
MDIIIFVLIGLIAGWLAGQIVKGRDFGLVGNLIIGVVGAFIGGYLFNILGISAGVGAVGSFITAFVGAVVLVWIIKLVSR